MLGFYENRILSRHDFLCRDPRERVEQCVECVRATRQGHRVTAQDIGEGVVKAPQVALGTPNRVFGIVPLGDHIRKRSLGNRAATERLNDSVMSVLVVDRAGLIRLDTLRVIAPRRGQLTECASEEHRKIAQDELRVPTSNLDLVMEREVIADERRGASVDASGKRLVVRVAQADHSPDSLGKREVGNASDLKQAKVALTITRKSVTLLHDFKASGCDSLAQTFDDARVRDRMPRLRGVRGDAVCDLLGRNFVAAAVECEVQCFH